MLRQKRFFGLCKMPQIDYVTCADCDEEFARDDCAEIDGEVLCNDCACERGWGACEDCGEWMDDPEHSDLDGCPLCGECFDRKYCKCNSCDTVCKQDESYYDPDGNTLCESCYSDSVFYCESCGTECWLDGGYSHTDYGIVCSDCHSEHDEGDFSPGRNKPFDHTESTDCIGSRRRYGVEVETDDCNGYTDLDGRSAWGAKDDCTCDAKELYSAILAGDSGLREISKLSDLADDNGWESGDTCGTHLHIDMTDESLEELQCIAYAYRVTQDVWMDFVAERRRNYHYCYNLPWEAEEAADCNSESYLCTLGNRSDWLNLQAYNKFTTFEVRLLEGTCDGRKLRNWTKAHLRFADWAASHDIEDLKEKLAGKSTVDLFDLICREAWSDNSELRDYWGDVGNYEKVKVAVPASLQSCDDHRRLPV